MPNFIQNILRQYFAETIHTAVEDGNTDKLKNFIREGEDINALDAQGRAPIHIASVRGDANMLSVLLKYQADPKLKSKNGYTALHLAKNADTASALLNSGVLVDDKGFKGYTPLHAAKLKGKVGIVKNFLEYGADIDVQNDNARDAMQTRGWQNSVEIEAMLRSAKDFDRRSDNLGDIPKSELFLNANNLAGFDKLKRYVHRKIRQYDKASNEEQTKIKNDFKKLLGNNDLKESIQSSLNEVFNISLKAGNAKTANSVYNIMDGNLSIEIASLENKRQIDNAYKVLSGIESGNKSFNESKEKIAGWHKNNPYDSITRYGKFKAISRVVDKNVKENESQSLMSSAMEVAANNQLDNVENHYYVRRLLERNGYVHNGNRSENKITR